MEGIAVDPNVVVPLCILGYVLAGSFTGVLTTAWEVPAEPSVPFFFLCVALWPLVVAFALGQWLATPKKPDK